jgi:hypothetical protein
VGRYYLMGPVARRRGGAHAFAFAFVNCMRLHLHL